MMEQRLSLLTLGVADLAKATAFYETKFGWQNSAASNANISFFTLNGIQLALYSSTALAEDATVAPVGSGFRGFTLAHNARSEAEVDELIATLRAKGVEIVKEPQRVSWGGYSSYVADLDGHLWEIAFNPFLELDEAGNVKA
jgi:catechol 2,3-dioxygenase-like lactoylglutathione lyase family enzyme